MNEYAGKKAVVTGGTHGMGLAMVEVLLDGGAEVLLTGRKERNLETARTELGPKAHVVRFDAARMSDIDALGAQVEERLGGIDALFVNHGYARMEPFDEVTEDSYDRQFDVNARGRSSPCSAWPLGSGTAARSSSPGPSPTKGGLPA